MRHKTRAVTPADYPEVLSWFAKRRLPLPPIWSFSDEGVIVPGVAAGFLYLTNSSIAYIDCYISNPEASKEDRAFALEEITNRIVVSAKFEHGVKMLCCNSKLPTIQELAGKFKFSHLGPHESFSKPL